MGEVPPELIFHIFSRLGLPPISTLNFSPESPLPFATNTQVLLSAGLTHTAGMVRISPPCSTVVEKTSPPVKPGPAGWWPLRLSRLIRRKTPSLPPCPARCGYLLVLGRMAGAVLPRSVSPFCRPWKFVGV